MRMRSMILFVALAMAGTFALAHGDQKHVVGTVEKISADSVVVKTSGGKLVEVKLVATTIYVKSDGKSAKLSDLAAGDRAVIHATPHGNELEANEVKFAKPGDVAASTAKPGSKP
jgi:hypothetical protein